MLKVTVIAVGKLRERFFADACNEYLKRLGGYCKPVVVEVEEYRLPEAPSPAEIGQCLQAEGREILKKIPKGARVVALCIEGKLISSEALAEELRRTALEASHLVWIIGGSHGLSEEVKRAASWKLSISPMTFPHQMVRMLLLEQLYRGFSIGQGGKYHK